MVQIGRQICRERLYPRKRLGFYSAQISGGGGKFDTVKDLIDAWSGFPSRFAIKSNNGCGTVKLIRNKADENVEQIRKIAEEWLSTKRVGVGTVEPHYTLIKPCIVVEEFLEDSSVSTISKSLIDYKIWCFNGKPYCIFVAFDRDIAKHEYKFEIYSPNWERLSHAKRHKNEGIKLPRPQNLETMLDIAARLSEGHPQMRVDLYNINGQIFFGELTLTSACGYMDYFSSDFLLEMGKQFEVE